MTYLYPRLPRAEAERLFAAADSLQPATEHRSQVFAPVGLRVAPQDIAHLALQVRGLASEYGFPNSIKPSGRIEFDRRATQLIGPLIDISWSEASSRDMWSFMALVALPDVTRWRWASSKTPLSIERWVASDLTRHTWARYWWRWLIFIDHEDVFGGLSESDLNQILERRAIGGDRRLAVRFSSELLAADQQRPGYRRAIVRDSSLRLLRRLAFIDARALDDEELADLCRAVVVDAVLRLPEAEDRAILEEVDAD